jgi:esterase/lipase superfamily enzyme
MTVSQACHDMRHPSGLRLRCRADMSSRVLILVGALSIAAPVAPAQTVSTIAKPELCVSVSADSLKRLEARRQHLELQIAAKAGAAGSDQEISDKPNPGLRRSQEELLQLLFRIECARSVQAEPASEPAPRRTREVRSPSASKRNEVIEVTTYYATNRNRSDSSEPAKIYGAEVESKFQYGRALVTIPPTHTPGNLEMPSLWKLERQSDPNKHFVLKSVTPLTADAARAEMTERLQGLTSKALLIFVHGYNTGFEEAALRTAQIAHDLRFPGMPFFFSWPSANQLVGYWQDEEAARLSEGIFEQLIEDLSQFPVTDIYIVAHSMGNRIVGHALQSRAEKGKETKQLRELLLAAPDVNANIFRTIIAPKLAAMQGTRTTIYAASSDVALMASKVVHGFKRVGDARGGVFVYPGIDTIDASSAASATRGYGHIYVVDSTSVMSDIRAIVDRKGAAIARGLSAVGASPNLYWRLP